MYIRGGDEWNLSDKTSDDDESLDALINDVITRHK